jgi:hypothetical protein
VADTYGVVAADVAAELPGVFPDGFTVATKPTLAQVTSLITTADTVVGLRVLDSTGRAPAVSDKAAVLAKRYILEWVKAQVLRIAYVGNAPADVANAVDPYDKSAAALLTSIDSLGEQAVGTGEAAPRVHVSSTSTVPVVSRDMVINDTDLDAGSSLRGRF